jgi:hypothetical protein
VRSYHYHLGMQNSNLFCCLLTTSGICTYFCTSKDSRKRGGGSAWKSFRLERMLCSKCSGWQPASHACRSTATQPELCRYGYEAHRSVEIARIWSGIEFNGLDGGERSLNFGAGVLPKRPGNTSTQPPWVDK